MANAASPRGRARTAIEAAAAIGAAAGFGIGIGEKLAGVETKENEAKRLVKQLYGVSIDNNLAKQIAGIAQQSYGGNVGMAVRSDQVRQLVRLYAEMLGQKTNLTALTPHAANLVESDGKLYQSAVYDNGQAYSYASPLPVYGGVSTQGVLPGGTVEEVRAAALACVRALAPEGTGLVAGASHRMQSDIPARNVEAMLDAFNGTNT